MRNWRELTQYDSDSVMHYPQCNGTNTRDLVLADLDARGAAALYPRGVPPTAQLLAVLTFLLKG